MISTDRKISSISIIIPTLNEAASLARTIAAARQGAVREILVVDGGSTDGTREIARQLGACLIDAAPGRAWQMNAAAASAQGEILLFLHADTLLPPGFAAQATEMLTRPGIAAGAFALAINLPGPGIRALEKLANLRASFLQMPYGDQAIFLYRQTFHRVGGYPCEPILEDVLLIKALKRFGRIGITSSAVLTSGRRWQRLGLLKTTLINQGIMAGYLLGVPPQRLQGWYGVAQKI